MIAKKNFTGFISGMDNISFTGIHNLRVFKSKDINNADRCTLRVSANLSNDRNGYDLSDFVNYLKKARKEYRDFCQYSDNPTSIDIDCLTIEDNVALVFLLPKEKIFAKSLLRFINKSGLIRSINPFA